MGYHIVKGWISSSTAKEIAMNMPTAHQTARRSTPNRNPLSFSMKAVMCTALIVVFGASVATTAGADPGVGGEPDPFGGLSCSCDQSVSTDGPVARQQVRRGMREAIANAH
ncbi:hypothetical protein A9W96_14950 [Mycobacterium sp. 1245852.3]|nr:hypothetical protein A9W96_14950 [Mycobacterium sp. 1245852.3]